MDEYFRTRLSHEALLPWGVTPSKINIPLKGFEHAHRLLSALCYLHSNQILHRNLTPDSVVMWKGNVYVTNLDSTDFVYASKQTSAPLQNSSFPDPGSQAPQLLRYTQYSNPAPGYQGDLWTLGCTLWELYSGEPAFPWDVNEDSPELLDVNIRCEILPGYLRPLVKRLLQKYIPPLEYDNLHEWLDDNLPGSPPLSTRALLKAHFVGFPDLKYATPKLEYLYPLKLNSTYLHKRKKMFQTLWAGVEATNKNIGVLIQQGQEIDAENAGINTPTTVSLFYFNQALQQAPKEMLELFMEPAWTTLDETTANQKVNEYLQNQALLVEPSAIV